MLTPAQVSTYREKGYLVVPNVLSTAQLDALKVEINKVLDQARFIDSHTDVFDLEDSHTRQNPRVRRIKLPHKNVPGVAELLRSKPLVDLMTPLLGPNVRQQTSKLNLKSAGYGAAVEWHQDWAYYPYTNDDVLALGVLLDEFADDNGAMMVVPGSHKGPIYDHHAQGRFCGGMDPRCGADFSKAVKLLAPPGSITLHHARLIHGSDINRSGKPRNFLLYEAMAADAWPLAGAYGPFTDLEEFNSRMIVGSPTIEPRLEKVPVRMPLPKPIESGSLYQSQSNLEARYFGVLEDSSARR
jgi:phytanoyl-CoA hydroxylase